MSRPAPSDSAPDEPSMTNTLLAPLADLKALSQTLFLSLSPAQSKPPPPPPVAAFLAADAALSAAIRRAHAHQIRQRKIAALMADILALDARWRAIVAALEGGRRELAAMIAEGDTRIQAIDDAKRAAIPYPELLAYAQSLSAFTSAPPNMPDLAQPGQAPPPLFFPPFPNEEKMRRGRLNAEAPLGLLGETHSVGRPPTISPPKAAEGPQLGAGANPYRQDHRPQQQQLFDLDLDLNPDL